jgi:putative transposase
MSRLHRHFSKGRIWFVTVVTANRSPILMSNSKLLLRGLIRAQRKVPFVVLAWVVLPDHIHALISSDDTELSGIIHRIKHSFTCQFKKRRQQISPIWQDRYWDHMIRSDEDLQKHLDYIHFNPVKHGLATAPQQWKFSSYRKYVKQGIALPDRG